tara:strand:+ start:1007 stop:1795 length:789 start_codon:yes stop_codon:yes gene_type:complete
MKYCEIPLARVVSGLRELVDFAILILFVSCSSFASLVLADEKSISSVIEIEERLRLLRPEIPIREILPTPVPSIFSIEVGDGTIWYGTEDGKYLFAGDMYFVDREGFINLSERLRESVRKKLIGEVKTDEMIIFSPGGEIKASIFVFTDVDCGYCQKLHLEVPELNRAGIEVRYLAFPRNGIGSDTYEKMVSAWCAEDRNESLSRLKARKEIPQLDCVTTIADQFELGKRMGITGTPAIIFTDGSLLPGYIPSTELVKSLGI